jgi:superfamily II DNA/RNA helicase
VGCRLELSWCWYLRAQAAGFAAMRAGQNVALQSHTGSGKTLAFMLPLLTRAIAQDREDTTHSQVNDETERERERE